MAYYDPEEIFRGVILIIAPHMDDEVLACGGTIARLPQKEQIHLVYATDGTRSPMPMFPWIGEPSPDLEAIRMDEARAAMEVLGVPEGNIHFLSLEDGELKKFQVELRDRITGIVLDIRPDWIFIPFRYDRHPDHLALTRATYLALEREKYKAGVLEYFVYNRYQLLSGGDIRNYIRPEHLIEIDISSRSEQKKKALTRYVSQSTFYNEWQNRPILTKERIDEVSIAPEVFLRYDPEFPGSAVFENSGMWIRFVHRIEPFLKNGKERMLALKKMRDTRNGSE